MRDVLSGASGQCFARANYRCLPIAALSWIDDVGSKPLLCERLMSSKSQLVDVMLAC